MNSQDTTPVSDLVTLSRWMEEIGLTQATVWRWRKEGILPTVNVFGRVYISRSEIAAFEKKAKSGRFAREHKVPRREEQ